MIDRLKLRFPLIGDIWLKAQVAQFVRRLSTLLSGGTPLVSASDTASEAMGVGSSPRRCERPLRWCAKARRFTRTRADTGDPGYGAGNDSRWRGIRRARADALEVAEFYEQEVDLKLTAILAWVEPAILVFMAAVVAFILIALYLPMFSLTAGTMH